MTVITISRQFGSGGDEIVATICRMTGFQVFDKHMIARAAKDADLSDQEVIDYSETNYKVQNFFDRLLLGPRPVAQVKVWKESLTGERVAEEMALTEENALALVRKAIIYAHDIGNVLIVGRGGQVVLQNYPDVLHVRLEAPLEDRLLRVRYSQSFAGRTFSDSLEARRAAQAWIEARDNASADYIKRYYGVDWSDPMLYHLLINTGTLQGEHAAQVIVDAARLLKRETVP